MKTLKKLFPLAAIVLGLGLVFSQSAFKAKTNTVWVFDGTSISQAKDADLYHVDMDAPSCELGESVPCKITSAGTSTDKNVLQSYLNTFPTDEDVLEAADGIRD